MRFQLVLVWSALALQSASCGRDAPRSSGADHATGTPAAASTGAKRKPCEYMARADAEAAVGQPLPKTTEDAVLGSCEYIDADYYGASLNIGEWESMKTAANGGAPSHLPIAVAGIGDEALTLNRSSMLYVRKGDRGFLVHLNGPQVDHAPDQGLERSKALALKILAKF